jgi:serine/threonine protein kinase
MSDPSFQAPSPEHLTELLPQYDIEAFIAQGAMGAVYKARQRSLDRDVAIKILPRELGEDPGFRESFTTEAKAMARLNHPNLIGVFDHGDVEGMPYIVM